MISMIDLKISRLENILGLEPQYHLSLDENEISNVFQNWSQADATLFVGDNLPYLKELALRSPGIVDMCYIDPPYNTGSKFLYNDSRKSDMSGHFGSHSAWMGFMLPRLVAARELLKESGVIAISIDDYEYTYLKILMDCIFGEDNFIGSIVVCRSKNGKGSKRNLASNHEYLLIYGKSDKASLRGQLDETRYDKQDKFGQYRVDGLFRKKGEASLKSDRPNMHYPLYFNPDSGEVSVDPIIGWNITYPVDSKGIDRRWLWSAETARERAWQLYASKKGVIYVKNYSGDGITQKRTKVRSLWSETDFYTERGTNEINKLFGAKVFDTPKPLNYIIKIIDICSSNDALILDFFAGSGTTAHAVAVLNSADMGKRKCILMESDSEIPAKHLAREMGFTTISEITEKRLHLIQDEYNNFTFQVIETSSISAQKSTYNA
ncbi:site-specific DNA-methyltransferase [Pectobacterium aroidearum]|uniref:site-specific DNA-methyltransferase n=1 Tax=Pectobacterium aroidearum TaxID=1201031 RepID=UPI0015F6E350|nr:site-specific DNA-methyltransferase [Pectobacterium aroidearum]MBA5603213.1 site-specific DNA-methyltransferase [Pectobacterium aroidearum]